MQSLEREKISSMARKEGSKGIELKMDVNQQLDTLYTLAMHRMEKVPSLSPTSSSSSSSSSIASAILIYGVLRAVGMGGRGGSPRPPRKIEIQKSAFWSKFKSRLFG